MSGELELRARRRMLNEPFFLMMLDVGLWLVSFIVYSMVLVVFDGERNDLIGMVLFRCIFTSLISIIIAFFVLEWVQQRWMAPLFFPKGGLYSTPKTYRIRIGTRLAALFFACSLVPFVAIFSILDDSRSVSGDPERVLQHIRIALHNNVLMFLAMGLGATFLVTRNLTSPLKNIINTLKEVHRGNLNGKVRVTTNDELGYTGDIINEMTEGLKERDLIKATFGKYVSDEIRDEILAGRIPLDGEIKDVTVLFADIRNFTPLTESIPPKTVVDIINRYFSEMETAIHDSGGLVLQYIGNEVFAAFGAPLSRGDHAQAAVRAALDMKRRLGILNGELAESGYAPLSHGIGINTGEVVAANIGSPSRLSYTLIGDTVNLASRLQELNKTFQTEIILSEATRTRLDGQYSFKDLPPTVVKGKSRSVKIYSIE